MLTKVWGVSAARLALVSALAVFGAAGEARAGDDGEAPLWQGITSVVGIGKPDDPDIEYREHGKLVLPPKVELPPPGANARATAEWPTDQDVQRAKKLKALKDTPAPKAYGKVSDPPLGKPGVPVTVTMSATAGYGPGGAACLKDGVAIACPDQPAKGADKTSRPIEWNPLTWVGLQKKADIVLGPEPERDFLTDPPPGFRAPAEGVGAKVQNN